MYTVKDLEQFRSILDNDRIDDKIRLRILKKVDEWEPIRDIIIASNIGKSIFKLSKKSGELGLKSEAIVNKWRSTLMTHSSVRENKANHIESTKLNIHNKPLGDKIKTLAPFVSESSNKSIKSSIWKRSNEETIKSVPDKKKCLSLSDYYKRNPLICPETKNESLEINSESGISFLDSITVNVSSSSSKSKPRGPLSKSELISCISDRSILQRKDIIKGKETIIEKPIVKTEELFASVPCAPTVYNYKSRHLPAVTPETSITYFPSYITNPPSLLQQCQTVLLNYKECIEEVLWTPRELLIHVLRAYSYKQLLHFESFNSRFIEENEDLWWKHCVNKYKLQRISDSCSTWRESFLQTDATNDQRVEQSINCLKSKFQEIQKEDRKKQTKIINSNRGVVPGQRRFFFRRRRDDDAVVSAVRRKLARQYNQAFRHLR